MVSYRDIKCPFFARAIKCDPQKAWAAAEKNFGAIERLTYDGAPQDEIGFITPMMTQREFDEKAAVSGLTIGSMIRVTDY